MSEISTDTTLDGDVVSERRPAFIVTADNVTLDLGGHVVSGNLDDMGTGPGILLRGVHGVTVRNGTVRWFDAAVVIDGGSGNLVEGLTVEDNYGDPDGDYGDGIVINNSRENRVAGCVVRRNGPFSGISLGPNSQANSIVDNTVADNNMLHLGPGAGGQTMGIRLEGPSANDNRVAGNVVTGNGADGIVVLSTCDDMTKEPPCVGTPPNERNVVEGNTAKGNGTSGRGSGIRIFAMPLPVPPVHNVLRDNLADDNAWYGIAIDSLPLGSAGNEAVGNRAHGNGEYDGSDGTLMPPCGRNVWRDNDFGTVNQPGVSKTSA
ncbi:MAG: right-handed parallel beta-helix repeat-containing protein [Acidimicrobiales bacterium]